MVVRSPTRVLNNPGFLLLYTMAYATPTIGSVNLLQAKLFFYETFNFAFVHFFLGTQRWYRTTKVHNSPSFPPLCKSWTRNCSSIFLTNTGTCKCQQLRALIFCTVTHTETYFYHQKFNFSHIHFLFEHEEKAGHSFLFLLFTDVHIAIYPTHASHTNLIPHLIACTHILGQLD